jgi:hypothetical protein
VSHQIELGAHATYSSDKRAEANYPSYVLDFPESEAGKLSVRTGVGIGGNIRTSARFKLSLILELGIDFIPQTAFNCTNTGGCSRDYFETEWSDTYRRAYASFSIEPVDTVTYVWAVLGHLAFTSEVDNVCFAVDGTSSSGDTIGRYLPLIVGVGSEARFESAFVRLSFDVIVSFQDAIGVMPGFTLTTGRRRSGRHRVPIGPEQSGATPE